MIESSGCRKNFLFVQIQIIAISDLLYGYISSLSNFASNDTIVGADVTASGSEFYGLTILNRKLYVKSGLFFA